MNWERAREAGFTLLELLVTLAIVLIVAGLLVTAIVKGKAKAVTIQCSNNLRQHGIALQSFVQEHSVYPLVLNPGSRLGIEPDHYSSMWAALARHGLGSLEDKTPSVHVCPGGVKFSREAKEGGRRLGGYAYNVHGMGRRLEDEALGLGGMTQTTNYLVGPVHESLVANPSGMIAMGDGVRGWDDTLEDGTGFISRTPDAKEYEGSNERVPLLHQKRLVILFADGHVVTMRLERLFQDRSDAALALWNRDGLAHRERLR